jgi:hypothetical protein
MKSLSAFLLAVFLVACIAFAGQGKKTQGRVQDADGLLKVHTFCLDASALTPDQSASLEKFVAQASKPKGVFAKLNWHLMDSCSSADATVKLTMEDHQDTSPTGDSTVVGDMRTVMKLVMISQAKMFITNPASGKMLYQVNGGLANDDRLGAFASPFLKLLKDLRTLPK